MTGADVEFSNARSLAQAGVFANSSSERQHGCAHPGEGLSRWREALFAMLSRNAGNFIAFSRLRNNSVVEWRTWVRAQQAEACSGETAK